MNAIERVTTALRAWESNDIDGVQSSLSDDFVGRGFLPQPVRQAEYSNFVQEIMKAVPDWSFNAHILNEQPVSEQESRVHIVTQVTGTHTGNLVLPTLPIVAPTGAKIALPPREIEYIVNQDLIIAATAAFSPNCLVEVLAQLGLQLPK